jgi:hypothetical protein
VDRQNNKFFKARLERQIRPDKTVKMEATLKKFSDFQTKQESQNKILKSEENEYKQKLKVQKHTFLNNSHPNTYFFQSQ